MKLKMKALPVLAVGTLLLLAGCGDAETAPDSGSTSAGAGESSASDPSVAAAAGMDESTPIMNVYSGEGYDNFSVSGGSTISLPPGTVVTDLFTEEPVAVEGSNRFEADMPDGSHLSFNIYPDFATQESVDSSLAYRVETLDMMGIYKNIEQRDLTWGDTTGGQVVSYQTDFDGVSEQGWMVLVLEGDASVNFEVTGPVGTLKTTDAFKAASTFKFAS